MMPRLYGLGAALPETQLYPPCLPVFMGQVTMFSNSCQIA